MDDQRYKELKARIDKRYEDGLIAWGIIDFVTDFLEKRGKASRNVSLDDIQRYMERIQEQPPSWPSHDREFAEYVFYSALSELDDKKYKWKQVNPTTWLIERVKPVKRRKKL